MEYEMSKERDAKHRQIEWNLKIIIPDEDMHKVKFDMFTNRLSEECDNSELLSDKLLFMEHIIRMIETNPSKIDSELEKIENLIKGD
jgi:hypothetical protein